MLACVAVLLVGCGEERQRPEVAAVALADLPETVEFNRHVRAILSNNCFVCHGHDEGTRKAGLRLDVRESAVAERDGRRPISPGDASASELVRRITHPDPSQRMPPADSKRVLTARDTAILTRWIDDGAEYQEHWAYIKPSRPPIPDVHNEQWVRNPIDRFLLANLERRGLGPSEEADPVTLIRRLSFDLVGLPPNPDEVQAFLGETSSERYEEFVDRLLDSPHYGERMALDWLDQVRYADSNGYHSDEVRSVYPYRDYVINAFNENKPFDTFTTEQIAGDLLPGAGTDQKVASGFNRLIQITAEGGAQPKEYRSKYLADRVRAVSSVWLGATMGCAQCHDHKFDPYTTKDFYSLGAFFSDIKEDAIANSFDDWAPVLLLPDEQQAAELAEIDSEIAELEERLAASSPKLTADQARWEKQLRAQGQRDRDSWMPILPDTYSSSDGSTLQLLDDFSLLSTGHCPPRDTYEVTFRTDQRDITGIRLEIMRHPSFLGGFVRQRGSFRLTEVEVDVAHASEAELSRAVIENATATTGPKTIDRAFDGNALTHWSGPTNKEDHPREIAVFQFADPIEGGRDTRITVRLKHLGIASEIKQVIGRFRLSLTAEEEPELDLSVGTPQFVLHTILDTQSKSQSNRDIVDRYYRTIAPPLGDTRDQLAKAHEARNALRKKFKRTLVSESMEPRVVRVLPRGDWLNDSGEIVKPAVPGFLPGLDAGDRGATRLDLARWLVDPKNPLTARVVVNRLWKLYFGTGLCKILDDLGSQGEWPVHPELLDWLAVEFMESGWDVKHIVRLMVTSAAYRQTSHASAELLEIDPYNRLIARQSRFRFQAEMIRDNALAVSGLLNKSIGGPSVKPYQPEGYWQHLNFPKRVYVSDEGDAQYRRGLYIHWQRSFLHPSLLAFDAPSREECVAERPVSNTPLQALTAMNDPTYVEAARVFAQRILDEADGTIQDRLGWAFQEALTRNISEKESLVLSSLYDKHLSEYEENTQAAVELIGAGSWAAPDSCPEAELAAWTSVARVILNLHEVITRA